MKLKIPTPDLIRIPQFNDDNTLGDGCIELQNIINIKMETTQLTTPVTGRGILVYDGEVEFSLYMAWTQGVNTCLKAIKTFHDNELMPISKDLAPEDVATLLNGSFMNSLESRLAEFADEKDPVLKKYTIDFYREHIDNLDTLIDDLKGSFEKNRSVRKDFVTKFLQSRFTDLNNLTITSDFQVDVSARALADIRPLFNTYKLSEEFQELTQACDELASAYGKICRIMGEEIVSGISAPMTGMIDIARLIKKTSDGNFQANVSSLAQFK